MDAAAGRHAARPCLLNLDVNDRGQARDFLHQCVATFRMLGAADLGYVLDDPLQPPQWQDAPDERHSLLLASGWTLVRETHRWERRIGDDVLPTGRLTYRTLAETGAEAFVAVVSV